MESINAKWLARILCLCAGLFFIGVAADRASASDYPNRPINLVVPFAPGGTMDVAARTIAEYLEKHLKQPVIVSSKPGGGTTIAGNFVATARPDGYTLGFLTPSTFVPELYTFSVKAPYSSRDLIPVSGVIEVAQAILVREDAPWNSLKAFMEYARKNPGVKIATLGKSHLSYLYITLVTKQENVTFVSIPFDGGSKMVVPILGGHVPIGITGLDPTLKSLIDSKKLKALAVCLKRRIAILPDIPCLEELGYKLPLVSISGLFAPKGTPADVVKKIDDSMRTIVENKDFQAKIYAVTAQLNYLGPAAYGKSLALYKEKTYQFFKEEGMLK